MRNKGKFANIVLASKAFMGCHIAFREGQSNPKIKQLEWDETFSHYFVESPVGTYTILRVHNFEEKELWRLYFNGLIMANDIDPDEAKAAAQKDFEERVEKCIAK